MIEIGKDYITGKPFSIDETKHTNIEGSSGMGKSTLLFNIFSQHIRNGNPGALIDPHGDLADAIAKAVPTPRMWDFIWFDPDAARVPPLNPLYHKDLEQLELEKESLQTTFKSLAGTAWGDETARVLINAIDAVCEAFKHPTAVHIFRFMADDKFRAKVLAKTANPLLKMFKEQYDDKLQESMQMAKFSPPINKVGKLLRPAILPIIGQPTSLSFLDIMNKNRILVARLSKGRLGEEIAQVLGSIIVSMFSIAALKREKQKKRDPFMLMIDETHNFTHGGRFGTLLAEGRKYGLSLVSATQGMYQLPFAKDLLANCPTQIIFNASGEDAELIAKNWGEDCAAQITSLPRYQFMVRSFENDLPIIRTIVGHPNLKFPAANRNKLIKHSLERWGTDKVQATARIQKFLAN
jgi:Type IV secretion-system coupling protein DNA-binding domain